MYLQSQPSGETRIRLYVKGQLDLGRLTFGQRRMYRIGDYATQVWKNRLAAGLSTQDQPAKPLARTYARVKSRRGLPGIRNLTGLGIGGHMLDAFGVRTVNDAEFRGGFTTTLARQKAERNEERESFCAFSPNDQRLILDYVRNVELPEIIQTRQIS